jgi:hypothetical protein
VDFSIPIPQRKLGALSMPENVEAGAPMAFGIANRTSSDVRSSGAIWGKADMAHTARFGSE